MSQQQVPASMNKRLIALGVMGVIAIGLFLLVRLADLNVQQNAEPTVDPFFGGDFAAQEPLFPEAELDVVTSIIVEDHTTGVVFKAELNDEGAWEITQAKEGTDTDLGVDEPRLSAALSGLPTLRPNSVLSEIEALAVYGLEEPTYSIWFTVSAGTTYVMDIGGTNPGESAYYATVGGLTSKVYLLPKFTVDELIGFLENPPYIQPTEGGTATPEGTNDEG